MKNRVIFGAAVVFSGLLIALGPQFLFKLCAPMANGHWMKCHWTGQAEIGVGLLIAALGGVLVFFSDNNVRLGLSIAVLFSGILALSFPTVLIGGCAMETMHCRSKAFPALTVISILTIVASAANIVYLYRTQNSKAVGQ